MAGKYNTWIRRKLADRIRSNGGYNRSWNEKFALSWTVYFYTDLSDLGSNELAQLLVDQGHFMSMADLALQYPDFTEWFESRGTNTIQQWYAWAWSQLVDDLEDDEGLRMWSPETAKRYGLDYVGPGAEKGFDMVLSNYGRNGKHVCLVEFEGVQLTIDNNELADMVDPDVEGEANWHVSNTWCRMLMGMLDELDEALTSENAKRCGLFYQCDYLMQHLTDDE